MRKLISLIAVSTILLHAQLSRGSITGIVTDPTGSVIPGATVVMKNLGTGETATAAANDAGQYNRPNLPTGDYEISVTAQGFKRLVRNGILLRVSEVLRVDMQLELGAVSESVEVTAEVPRLQSETAEVGTTIDNRSLINLPLSFGSGGRRPDAFAFQMTPGIAGSVGTNPSTVNGSTAYSKEMLVEGASVTVNQSGDATAALISPEALQEVKVQTSGLSAEFGRTQTGVFNYVMKSGSNKPHGSLYYGLRNEALNANTFANKFRGVERATDRKQNYAGSFGGPVVLPKLYDGHNRTFFHFAYERYKERSYGLGAPTRTVPVPEFYEGDFLRLLGPATNFTDANGNRVLRGAIYDPASFRQLANGRWVGDMFPNNRIPVSRFSQVSRNLNEIAKKHYIPTLRDASGLVPLQQNSYFPTSGQPEWDRHQIAVKADQILSSGQRVAFSMSYHSSPRFILDSGGMWDPNDIYGGPLAKGRRRDDTGSLGRLAHDWTLSPRVLNHFSVSFNHRDNPQKGVESEVDGAAILGIRNLSTRGYPVVNWGGGPFVTQESAGFISDSYRADASWGVMDTVSFSAGRHFLKMGFDHRRMHQNNRGSSNSSFVFSARATAIPNESYSGTQIGYAFASYLLGIVDNATQTDLVPLGGRRHYYGLFVQDDFKVSPRLTINVGLRWDFQPPAFEVADRLSSWNPQKTDPLSGLPGAYDFAGDCSGCTGRSYFGKKDYLNFGPRLGIAWRGPRGFIVRASYGVLYEGDSFNGFSPTPLGKPTSVQAGGTWSLESNPVQPWAGIFNWDSGMPVNRYQPAQYNVSWGNQNRPGMIDPDYGLSPYVHQWNFNIQREVFRKTVLDAGYLGNKGTRLRTGELYRLNQLPVSYLNQYGTRLNNAIRSEADARANGIAYPYPGFIGTVGSALRAYPQVQGSQTVQVYGSPLGFSNYQALQVTLNREMRRGLGIYTNYTWSKTLSNVDSSFHGDNDGRPLDGYNLKLEKAVAELDQPHMFKGYVSYDLPFRGKGFLRHLVGGWSVSAIMNYYSGRPLTFTAPTALSGSWNGATNRANIAPGGLRNPSFNKSDFELSTPSSPVNTYLNKALFSVPAPLTLGAAARRYTQIRGMGVINEDLGVQKSHYLRENLRFQLRAEFLNVFNRHNLGGLNTAVNNLSFGQLTSASGNRQVQVSARIDF